ncbi:ankyrin repeat-containing protein ITN1-like protein, partial [Tanacetum coccineum]
GKVVEVGGKDYPGCNHGYRVKGSGLGKVNSRREKQGEQCFDFVKHRVSRLDIAIDNTEIRQWLIKEYDGPEICIMWISSQLVDDDKILGIWGTILLKPFHLAAHRGDVMAIKRILAEINEQMSTTIKGAEFNAEVAEIWAPIVNKANELGETGLFTHAKRGYIEVVKELLSYTTKGIC